MDLAFSDADLGFRAEVRDFIEEHFPQSHPYTDTPTDEQKWTKALIDRGWSAYKLPADFGGTGWTTTQKFIWERETALRGLPPDIGGAGLHMLAPILYGYGTDEQKSKYMPGILTRETEWCQGYSEPGSGSDLASLNTKAVREGDHYIVNGEKIWTSGAHKSDMMFCLTRTNSEGKKQQGITFLLIDMKTPGINVHPIIGLDLRHSLNRVTFDDVRVPVENRIGDENNGWTYAKGLLTHERTGLAFISLSLRKLAALKRAMQESRGDGSTLRDDPAFTASVAAVEADLTALEFTELRTLSEAAAGQSPGVQSSFLKLKGTHIVQRITELFVECMAYYGFPYSAELLDGSNSQTIGPEYAREEMALYMIGRSASIAGGSDEVQRNITAKHVLGL